MNKLTVEDLLNLVKSYNPDEMEIIKAVTTPSEEVTNE